MGLVIRRPSKSKINYHHHSYKPNGDLEAPLFHKTSEKMQSQDQCENLSRDQMKQFLFDVDLLSKVMKYMDEHEEMRSTVDAQVRTQLLAGSIDTAAEKDNIKTKAALRESKLAEAEA